MARMPDALNSDVAFRRDGLPESGRACPVALARQKRYFAQVDWHVLYLRPRCEKKMAEFCRMRGFAFYLPLRRETKIYQRRKVTVEKPVFPGYLFAPFDADGRVALLKSNNIVRILKPASRRLLLYELAQIRRALQTDPTLSTCAALKAGHRVRILTGPFMGIEGVVDSLRGKTKVCLNVEMIGRAVAVELDREFLELMGDGR
jgi:transcription antitermination factor NusG